MIRASTLRGRTVVDLNSGNKLGRIEDIILDPAGHQIAGYIVGQGPTFLGNQTTVVPGSSVHAIGPDVITAVLGDQTSGDSTNLGSLPRLSHVTERKMVTEGGKLLGAIHDVVLADNGLEIAGYALRSGSVSGLENLMGRDKEPQRYVRADANLRVGHDVIVVPDDAVIESGATTRDRAPDGDAVLSSPDHTETSISGDRRTIETTEPTPRDSGMNQEGRR